jgi:hypothetical protein
VPSGAKVHCLIEQSLDNTHTSMRWQMPGDRAGETDHCLTHEQSIRERIDQANEQIQQRISGNIVAVHRCVG